jgi:hypothetical protein
MVITANEITSSRRDCASQKHLIIPILRNKYSRLYRVNRDYIYESLILTFKSDHTSVETDNPLLYTRIADDSTKLRKTFVTSPEYNSTIVGEPKDAGWRARA